MTGDGQQVTIPSGGSETVHVTDTYQSVGSLLVRKTIAGPGAGQQGEITIHTECNGTALTPDFVIPAGAPAGDQTKQYDQIPVPAKCTVTETADGHTSTVSVVVTGNGQTVSVPAGDIVEADISDTYGLLPGQLEVSKTITGPLAGQQGPVVIQTVCNGTPLVPDFVIPAGAPAGVQSSQLYTDIAAPASCVVTETTNGSTSAASVVVTGSPQTASVSPAGAGAADITDTYGATPGSLLVTKTIAGPLAGHQGPVKIQAACDGTALAPDFVIPAGTPAGSVSHSFDDIPAGSQCTVTETADGATATVTATVPDDRQKVTIPAGKVVPVNVIDEYRSAPGSLEVTKTITGPAAPKHGHVAILVECGGPVHAYAFLIQAHLSRTVPDHLNDLPAGSHCTATETSDGHTGTIAVVATGTRKKTTIRANHSATLHLTDIFATREQAKPKPPPVTG